MKTDIEKSLSIIEKVSSKIEQLALRVSVFEALKHLIVGGNCLTYLQKKGSMRVFPLSQYVVRRDASGNVLEIVICEKASILSLGKEVSAQVIADPDYKSDENRIIYTYL